VRTFREKAVLSRQLAERSRDAGKPDQAARFEEDARQAERQGELIRQCLHQPDPGAAAG
jgi:hypothetical protein